MTFKKCKNDGCEIIIEVRNTAEGWRPYEESGNKHNCQFSDYAKKQKAIQHTSEDSPMREKKPAGWGDIVAQAEDKDDHGNETFVPVEHTQDGSTKTIDPGNSKVPEYVDHTAAVAKGSSKAIIFFGSKPSEVTDEYNTFCARPNVKGQGAHDHVTKDDDGMLFTIFLYYEEVAK